MGYNISVPSWYARKLAPKKGLDKMTEQYFNRETVEIVAQAIRDDYPLIGTVSTNDVFVNEKGEVLKDDSNIYSRSYINIWKPPVFMFNIHSQEHLSAFLAMCYYIAECDGYSQK
jgi:hypothetical protein